MRRLTMAVGAAVSSLALMGCEDGPNQTYSPSPAGAGDLLNNGNTGPSFDPVRADFDASYPGRSRQEICSAEEKQKIWAKMLNAPIEPPRRYGQLDMAGSDNWEGLTIESAEKVNCQAVSDGNGASHWGDNSEVDFFYNIGTHIVTQMELQLGYGGKMTFKGRQPGPGATCYNFKDKNNVALDPSCPNKGDEYKIGVGGVILKNNLPFYIHWDDDKQADADITEVYDAAIATFSKATKADANCNTSGACLVLADAGDGTGIFGFRPLAVYFIVRQFVPQPLPSTPFTIYNFFVKNEPYSNAPMTIKIDAEGPVAHQMLGPQNASDCSIKLGTTFKSFVDNCVNVSGDPAEDRQNFAKLVGGRVHDFDNLFFSVIGVNTDFTLKKDTYSVVQDSDLPAADDQATEWIFDVRAKGAVANDIDMTGKLDNHGTGLVFREYARLVQEDLAKLTGRAVPSPLGASACLFPTPLPTGFDQAVWLRSLPASCTGFEGLMLPGPKVAGQPAAMDALVRKTGAPYNKSFLKPGDPKIYFCDDPLSRTSCNGSSSALGGPVWDESFRRVIQVLGKGDVFNLPVDARDRRYFFRHYSIALIKYLKAYGSKATGLLPADVAAQAIDLENLLFDISDTDSDDQVKYVERDFVDATHEPTTFIYQSDVKVGNQRQTHWDRRLDRDEEAMYKAIQEDRSLPLGKEEPFNLTNLFGSPILTGNWESVTCATVGGTGCAGAPFGVNDSKGRPLMAHYKGAWSPTVFHQGVSPIRITGLIPNFQGAKVEIPVYEKPFDLTSKVIDTIKVLVPHLPKQPGVGFHIPITGSRDKVVTTAQLDFSGNTSNYLVNYDFATCEKVAQPSADAKCDTKRQDVYACARATLPADAACKASQQADVFCCDGVGARPSSIETQNIKILAIETRDFLGDVFMCQDPRSGDILRIRMYDSSQTILNWFNSHPGTIDACDVIIRYAPFNNYLDKITSRTNGVTLDISKSQGNGRVDDADLWDPALAAQ